MKYTVAVRSLCEFTAKQGDLDLRFTPSPSAQEGMAGHAVVSARRAPSYERELSLSGEYARLCVRGRADGYDPERNQLEEIKTFRGDLQAMPDNHRHLHWAQVKVYGWLLCQARGLAEVRLALVYFDIVSQKETILVEHYAAEALKRYFEQQCERFLSWAGQELAHRQARDEALGALSFAHASLRPGQRQLAEAAYKSAVAGRSLLAQAPTGIGKTLGTLFPTLKAAPRRALDKVFFLTAKSSGRELALQALALLRGANPGLPLRVLALTAREKTCEHPDKACHGASCPLARGFYDRLPAAREAALAAGLEGQPLREVALAHDVCPYYLGQDLVRWSDVVIGDYNYFFDGGAVLYAMTLAGQWRVSVLVDEAHNLIERSRKMYSATLDQEALRAVRRNAPPALRQPLDRLARRVAGLHREQSEVYQVHTAMPDGFLNTLQQALSAITDFFSENPTHADSALQGFYFDALHFARLAESFGTHSLFDVEKPGAAAAPTRRAPAAVLGIRNVVPAPFLAPRLAAANNAVLFSATLNPPDFYHDMLGLPRDSVWIDVPGPFTSEQLTVRLAGISTRYRDREESLAPITQLIGEQFETWPGNYLVFFSSFDYLRRARSRLTESHPHIPIWEQSPRMSEAQQQAFLARFEAHGQGIGFAVLGGSFGEGIDLPGARLIGAFIATLGLPQVNPVNEEMKERMGASFGPGYEYTYLYPGIQKVVQAAGRVIRTEADRGVVFLLDDRFARPEIRRLLPGWWKLEAFQASATMGAQG